MAEAQDSWLSTLGVDIDKLRQKSKAQSAATDASADALANTAINDVTGGMRIAVNAAPVPQGVKDAAATGINFEKGVFEGAYVGVKGLAGAVQTAGDVVSGVALAKGAAEVGEAIVSNDARKDLISDVTGGINKAAAYGNMIANPIGTAIGVGTQVVEGYEQASAQGQTAEFLGKGVGMAAVATLAAAVGGEAEVADLASAGGEEGGLVKSLGEDEPLPSTKTPSELGPETKTPDELSPSTKTPSELAPATQETPTFPNDPANPYQGQPVPKIEDPDAEPPPSTQDRPSPSTKDPSELDLPPDTRRSPTYVDQAPQAQSPPVPETPELPPDTQRDPSPPVHEEGPAFPNDPPNPYEGQPPTKIEEAPVDAESTA